MKIALLTGCALALLPSAAQAENLFHGQTFANVATDQKAARAGDILTVIVYQAAETRNAADNGADKRHSMGARFHTADDDQFSDIQLGGSYSGHGEMRRSQSFLTQISVTVERVLENGDLEVSGNQIISVNGERTTIRVRGRVRAIDIDADNRVLSTRIANAEINYNGQGFVSRNAGPGIVHRLFSFLGLGG